ncbi:uncharacterized protein BXZ73DRAFT_104051 [Epithele typhae]|uniref:uncharacterized protein n=1 Tax=Epithele typhae TaxID=378194 RepID=UPI0020083716|nr:uncharacterized protein BXZ73DRAFT_104051 [Epithele typhae]KAH9922819.1 hypothetical protein BXZ73DRAFT_104051 [Epithele typhae]
MRGSSSLLYLLGLFATTALAHPGSHDAHDSHIEHARSLPGSWFHARNHPAHKLFKKSGDGQTYPDVGSDEWMTGYPTAWKNIQAKDVPQAWIDALNAAKAAGKIPDIPVSTQTEAGTNPTYPDGHSPTSKEICSSTYKECRNPDDIWDAPDGVFASSFDDGPDDASMTLYEFLNEQKVVTTHFMIGSNVLSYPKEFTYAFETMESDIAVHTWSHPYMTTLSNEQVLGELGWTMQVIHNSTGGRLPKFWRPPFGDSDERVRAIAKEVLGLTTVIWNQDTADWAISTGYTTTSKVESDLAGWLAGPKSPGLIVLEHELTSNTHGWKFESLARMNGSAVYQNAADSAPDADVAPARVGAPFTAAPAGSTSATSSAASSKVAATGNKQHVASSGSVSAAPTSATSPVPSEKSKSGAGALASPASRVGAACVGIVAALFALS